MGKRVQSTFLHSTVGLSILPDDQHYVARIGTKVCTGVEVDPDSLFKSTAASHIPDLIDLIKADDEDKFKAVTANIDKAKNQVRCFALLTPMLAQAIHDSAMLPAAIFTKILECIKVGAVIPTTTTTTVEQGIDTNTRTSPSSSHNRSTTTTTSPSSSSTTPEVTDTEDEILIKL